MSPEFGPNGSERTLRAVADELGVHYMTVYRWVRTGRMAARQVGTEWRVDDAEIARVKKGAATKATKVAPRAQRSQSRGRAGASERVRQRLMAGDEKGAWTAVEEVLASGADPESVYLEVLSPAMRAIGEGWAAGTVSVADEHLASVVASRLVARLGPRFSRPGRKRGTVLVGAPADEDHALPIAMVADILRGEGYAVIDLGANAPPTTFVDAALAANGLVAVAICATNPGNERNIRATTRALRGAGLDAAILLGGGAVSGPDAAVRLGADGWSGPTARTVIEALEAISATDTG